MKGISFFIYQYEQDLNLRQASPNSTSLENALKQELHLIDKF